MKELGKEEGKKGQSIGDVIRCRVIERVQRGERKGEKREEGEEKRFRKLRD